MIKKLFLKLWRWIIAPHRIKKVKEAAGFHKVCEYHQQDIEHLFDKGVFNDWVGCAEIHRGEGQKIKDTKIFIRRLM